MWAEAQQEHREQYEVCEARAYTEQRMVESQMHLIMKLHTDEARHAERLKVSEAEQESAYDVAQRRLDTMKTTHRLYQEKTEQEVVRLRPYAE